MPDIKKVLVVDDDESMLEFCLAALSMEGFAVVAASTGRQAAAHLATMKFDLVLTDHVTVGASAVPIIKAAKAIQPETPVVLMSGIPHLKEASTTFLAGAEGYLSKPFTLDQLKTTVSGCMQA